MERISQKLYLNNVQSLSKKGLYLAMTNQNLSTFAEQNKVSFIDALKTYSKTFSTLEWKTDLKTLIGEATLCQLSNSSLQSVIVHITGNNNSFKEHIGFQSELWKQFISQLISLSSKTKFHIIVSLDRFTVYSPQLMEALQELKEHIFPIPLAFECEHRSWKNPESLKVFSGNKANIIQRDMPMLLGFQTSLPNYDSHKIYFRLLGRNQINWFSNEPSLRYSYDYQQVELRGLSQQIISLASEANEVYVVTAHRPASVALANILELAHFLSIA